MHSNIHNSSFNVTCYLLGFRIMARDHVMPVLTELHWLPNEAHIQYKLLLLLHQVLVTKVPKYMIMGLIASAATLPPCQRATAVNMVTWNLHCRNHGSSNWLINDSSSSLPFEWIHSMDCPHGRIITLTRAT